jgi:pimeloyl-ACP methyl ester carboxylesterase
LTLRGLYRAAQPGQRTIVFFHGNGDSLSGSLVSVEAYVDAGYGLLLPEYRGYGGNPGAPDEAGLCADARAARSWLEAKGVAADAQILVGYSLGSGVATQLALERPPAALILIAPYTSLPDVVTHRFGGLVPGLLVKDRFETANKIGLVRSPILIMHDRDDGSIPAAQGQRLASLAKGSKLLLFSGYGHQLGFAAEAQAAGVAWLAALRSVQS